MSIFPIEGSFPLFTDPPARTNSLDAIAEELRTCKEQFACFSFRKIKEILETCKVALSGINGTLTEQAQLQLESIRQDHAGLCKRLASIIESRKSLPTFCKPIAVAKQKETPPLRTYLHFERERPRLSSVETQKEWIESLKTTLVTLGLQDQIKYEVQGDTILFHHSGLELTALADKYKELKPFFLSEKGNSSFGRVSAGSTSQIGLRESEDLRANRLGKIREFIRKAGNYFDLQEELPPVSCTVSQDALTSEKAILRDILVEQAFPGICIGEKHLHRNPKRFLIENMEALKEMGVATLFMEHLHYDTMQPYLDAYLASDSETMPPILDSYLQWLDKEWELTAPYTYKEVVRKAKTCGIRVVGIDTSVAADSAYKLEKNPVPRVKAFNYAAEKIINHEQGSGKYVALMGKGHGSRNKFAQEIPGVADLLRCPNLVVHDPNDGTTSIQLNVKETNGAHTHVRLQKP